MTGSLSFTQNTSIEYCSLVKASPPPRFWALVKSTTSPFGALTNKPVGKTNGRLARRLDNYRSLCFTLSSPLDDWVSLCWRQWSLTIYSSIFQGLFKSCIHMQNAYNYENLNGLQKFSSTHGKFWGHNFRIISKYFEFKYFTDKDQVCCIYKGRGLVTRLLVVGKFGIS